MFSWGMGALSRRKGASYEREVATDFRSVFPGAKRGSMAQSRDSSESPDVDIPGFWPECKRGRITKPQAALDQAIAAVPDDRIPIAVCRDDKSFSTVTMRLEDFLDLLAEKL